LISAEKYNSLKREEITAINIEGFLNIKCKADRFVNIVKSHHSYKQNMN
jgi:hypothetical protein